MAPGNGGEGLSGRYFFPYQLISKPLVPVGKTKMTKEKYSRLEKRIILQITLNRGRTVRKIKP